MSIEIVPALYDCNTVVFHVRDMGRNGYLVAEGCETMAEAESERDAYLGEMYAFNDGPFSAAQSSR